VARYITVADGGDERLAPYADLIHPAGRRAIDRATEHFVVEGVVAIGRLLASEYRARSVLATAARAEQLAPSLVGREIDVLVAPLDVMRAVAGFDIHRGAVALADRPAPLHVANVIGDAQLIIGLEGLNDHENLGAIARSAHALAAGALLLDPACPDPLYRRCVRVSMGEILFLPFARTASWPDGLSFLRELGFVLVALTPRADAVDVSRQPDTLAGRRVALLLGAEGPGLSAATLAAADVRVRIPMRADADSINVGHAAAIALDRFHRR
jgi:tRNA G18 (ribose-2'-O)-methylase SpoU